jgi:hypothetical protein
MQRDTEEKVKKRRKIDTHKRGNLKKKKKKRYSASSWAEEAGRLTMYDVGGWGNPSPLM